MKHLIALSAVVALLFTLVSVAADAPKAAAPKADAKAPVAVKAAAVELTGTLVAGKDGKTFSVKTEKAEVALAGFEAVAKDLAANAGKAVVVSVEQDAAGKVTKVTKVAAAPAAPVKK